MTQTEFPDLTPETRALIEGQEGRSVDFKLKPEGIHPEDFVAFANARGGSILVGVEEQKDAEGRQYGVVVGTPVEDRVRQMFVSMAASCRPALDIEIRIENLAAGLPIFRIDIPEGPNKPYCTGSGTYKTRAEGQNIPLDPTMMRALILEQEAREFVTRFKQASEDLLARIALVHDDLTTQLARVEGVAQEATRAAEAAQKAAVEAGLWSQSSDG